MDQVVGFGVSGYRSFGPGRMQLLAPMSKVNLLVGANNSGKSNVLRFAESVLGRIDSNGNVREQAISTLDRHRGDRDTKIEFAVGVDLTLDALRGHPAFSGRGREDPQLKALAEILQAPAFTLGAGTITWLKYSVDGDRERMSVAPQVEQAVAAMTEVPNYRQEVAALSSKLSGSSGGGVGDDLNRVLSRLRPRRPFPPVKTIDSFRQVRPGADDQSMHSGAGLIEALARLERPDVAHSADRQRFDAITRFVSTVLDDPSVTIEIPHHRETINIQRQGLLLPLEHLGTGIHEVVIIAAAATLIEDHVVCIEEPEVHLHPILQRKLLRYLANETSNQYLIATHSAHMLDTRVASIFHVALDGKQRTLTRFTSRPDEQAAICADLGYRPSDLVQSNFIIWVEGPSDRIYIRHWLSLTDPALVEGIHYSLMFYGGRLLNHLSANDPEIDDFIALRRLNRNLAIVIDSDKRSAQARINKTKKRVVEELSATPELAWITKGYAIESYVPAELLRDAAGACHPRTPLRMPADIYSSMPSNLDKISVAREVADRWDEHTAWPLDLRRRIRSLAAAIRTANDLE